METDGLILLAETPALGDEVELGGEALKALGAWKPRPALAVTVTGPDRASFRARVIELARDRARLLVFEKMPSPAESGLEIILLQALPEKERMEIIIEKAAELGAAVIAPWKADKGISLAERDARQEKSRHWQRRALKAARQCRRGRVPAVMPCGDLESALDLAADCGMKIALHDKAAHPLKEALLRSAAVKSAAVLIGPEGGLTEEEVEKAKASGFIPVSLGSRILRAETAAVTAVAILQYALGDLGL